MATLKDKLRIVGAVDFSICLIWLTSAICCLVEGVHLLFVMVDLTEENLTLTKQIMSSLQKAYSFMDKENVVNVSTQMGQLQQEEILNNMKITVNSVQLFFLSFGFLILSIIQVLNVNNLFKATRANSEEDEVCKELQEWLKWNLFASGITLFAAVLVSFHSFSQDPNEDETFWEFYIFWGLALVYLIEGGIVKYFLSEGKILPWQNLTRMNRNNCPRVHTVAV